MISAIRISSLPVAEHLRDRIDHEDIRSEFTDLNAHFVPHRDGAPE